MVQKFGHQVVEVRKASDLDSIHGLILPGGESTAISKLLMDFQLITPIRSKVLEGLSVLGTYAGLILMAKEVENDPVITFNLMDIVVKRNAYGRQLNSFVTEKVIPKVSENPLPLVFIRAPYISQVGPNVEVLCQVNSKIVAVKEGNMLGVSFHPELTANLALHGYSIEMIKENFRRDKF